MPSTDQKIAFGVIADVHFSLNPPIFRSKEENWLKAQTQAINQVISICNHYKCPLVIAGDLFHKWDEKPEAISQLMEILHSQFRYKVFTIAGNHDVPNHSLSLIKKTAYYVLQSSGVIIDLWDDYIAGHARFEDTTGWICGSFPIGKSFRVPEYKTKPSNKKHIAIIHDYCWIDGMGFPGAPKDKYYKEYLKRNNNYYDVLCFGDNHKGFIIHDDKTKLVNCGGLTIRNSDERKRKPFMVLVNQSGKIHKQELDTSTDIYDEELIQDAKNYGVDENMASQILDAASKLGETFTDFRQVVQSLVKTNAVKDAIKDVIKNWLNIA